MMRGNINGAMQTLAPKYIKSKCLHLDDVINGVTVCQVIKLKHPEEAPVQRVATLSNPLPDVMPYHAYIFNYIFSTNIVEQARRITESADPSGVNAKDCRHMLVSFDRDSSKLAEALV
ncbi:hypothetical protein GJ496_004170 [Pomphorhynchus laevis]|nr:hypothetical protein GJ496_004170 [Pomphorhynchus laevis]